MTSGSYSPELETDRSSISDEEIDYDMARKRKCPSDEDEFELSSLENGELITNTCSRKMDPYVPACASHVFTTLDGNETIDGEVDEDGCSACGRSLAKTEMFVLTKKGAHEPSEQFHGDCFVCNRCHKQLSEQDMSCYVVKEDLYCSLCREIRTHCYRCHLHVAPDQWVHHFNDFPFHISCFTCQVCNKQMSKGDNCGMVEDRLLCIDHYREVLNGKSESGSESGSKPKAKRVRTSFTNEQMAILLKAFERDHNPDGADLERIANEAGLNKRVTQVWFQNARARKKKTERSSVGPNVTNNGNGGTPNSNNGNNSTSGGGNNRCPSRSGGNSLVSSQLPNGPVNGISPMSANSILNNAPPSISPLSASPTYENGRVSSVTPPEYQNLHGGSNGMQMGNPLPHPYSHDYLIRDHRSYPLHAINDNTIGMRPRTPPNGYYSHSDSMMTMRRDNCDAMRCGTEALFHLTT